jgi:4,4'-diaponeurosporenoate glycosyltransferase
VAEYRTTGGLLSVQPYHVTLRAYERLAAGLNITLMMGMNVFTPLGERLAPSGAFGPCVVCSRQDYFATGGHRSVRSAILEDSFLGRVFARAGLPVRCLGGRDTISFRMYPEGLGQVIEGWTKTLGSGSTGTQLSTLLLLMGWVAGCLGVVAAPVALLADPIARADVTLWALCALSYWAFAAQVHWMLRRIGEFGVWPAPAYPVLAAFYIAVGIRAVALMLGRRQVRWKGRNLATRPFREVGWGSDAKPGR